MSLHQLAKHVQNQGRGNDTMLMHVTPNEVKGLQSLAKAAGGSLSINPNTGLPEANFLESVLPVAIGAGLMAMGVPSPLMAAGITGLGYTAASGGNLQKGLMAGLGAYGGAGLTAGLTEAGASALGSAATEESVKQAAAQGIAPGEISREMAAGAFKPEIAVRPETATLGQKASAGFDTLRADPTKFFKQNMFPIGATALGIMGMQPQSTLSGPTPSPGYIRPYTFSQTRNPNYGQPGQPYFTQTYTAQTPIPADQYGATMMADGGLATLPDARLALNATYPQSMTTDTTQYATPYQMPTSAENLAASYEMATSPYTGEPIRMAEGGDTKAAVDQYNKMMSERAAMEYTRPEEFKQQYYTQAPVAPTAPSITPQQGIEGLYQYYLGRAPSAEEVPQWANKISGDISPEEAAYFRNYIGAEQAQTGYKPTGADPFGTYQTGGGFGSGFMSGIGGLPTFTYNPQTMQYTQTGGMQPDYGYMGMDPAIMQQMMAEYQSRQAGVSGAAGGGMMPQDLGGYSDGGRLLKGPGDGVSDSIPAVIGNKQPARLADGEFVIPARIVSELGNGSTDAGARKLYGMMDRIQKKRKKSVKGKSFAIDSKADEALPA
jgi:hypothetical protein